MNHLHNKVDFKTPEILYHKFAENGKYIIGETFMTDDIYGQETHDSFDETTKSNILQQMIALKNNITKIKTYQKSKKHITVSTIGFS